MNVFWKNIFLKNECTDEKILIILEDGSPNNEQKVMDCLYRRLIRKVMRWVLSHGGSEADGQDTLVEALGNFVINYRTKKYVHVDKLDNYVFGIAMCRFFDICRKRKQEINRTSLDELLLRGISPDIEKKYLASNEGIEDEKEAQLLKIEAGMAQLDEKCKERLIRFYFDEQSHEEIADAMGDGNANVSKTQLFRCKKKLENLFQKPK